MRSWGAPLSLRGVIAGRALAVVAGLAVACAVVAVRADVVILKNGNRFEGEASPIKDGRVRVVVDEGVVFWVDEEDIDRIEYATAPARVLEERLGKLDPGDLDGHLELAAWARERKVDSGARRVYRHVLRIDPNNTVARAELGFAVYRNRWVLESELKTQGLVRHEGEWMLPAERDRRVLEGLRRDLEEDFRGVDSENEYVQEYSIRRVMERKGPWMRHLLADWLAHPRQAVRVVAVQALAAASDGGDDADGRRSRRKRGPKRDTAPEVAPPTAEQERALDAKLAKILLQRTVEENNAVARSALANALMRIRSRPYFDLVMVEVKTSTNALHRERAAEGALFALRKEWVPEFIAALGTPPPGVPLPGNPAVRRVLERVFKQQFEYSVADWQAWWRRNSAGYTDA